MRNKLPTSLIPAAMALLFLSLNLAIEAEAASQETRTNLSQNNPEKSVSFGRSYSGYASRRSGYSQNQRLRRRYSFYDRSSNAPSRRDLYQDEYRRPWNDDRGPYGGWSYRPWYRSYGYRYGYGYPHSYYRPYHGYYRPWHSYSPGYWTYRNGYNYGYYGGHYPYGNRYPRYPHPYGTGYGPW